MLYTSPPLQYPLPRMPSPFCILYTPLKYVTSHCLSWFLWLNTVCSFWAPILYTSFTGLNNFSCLSLSNSLAQFKCEGFDNTVQGYSNFSVPRMYTADWHLKFQKPLEARRHCLQNPNYKPSSICQTKQF
jgi:hypothetical protein